ncbi:putative small multi-drug export protein [bacterium BMS3Abin15]|nr:putative small multi-drug export protein [bacterium BMS3Abin15]HDZ85972.1 ligand-binding protein SH3 [Candidatus Moranbacteria bacterium]
MQDIIISWFTNFPAELATFLMAMVPVTELRASIPVAIVSYNMAPFWAFFWSVLGNTLMGIVVVLILEPVTGLIIKRVGFLNSFWEKYIERVRSKNERKFERWGAVALIAFVAIPLPMTGAFTGGVAASIFQVPVKTASVLLLIGCIIAGIIVTGITLGFNGL